MTEEKTYALGLGPLDSEHVAEIRAWRNDYRIWKFTRQNDYLDDIEHGDWFARQTSDPTVKMYSIMLSDGEAVRVVGVCGFTSVDYRNSRAEFSLYIAPGFQRQGLGKKALSILLGHGFENHGFRLIYGETFADNPAAGMFEALGFRHEGTRREFYYKAGRHIDAHLYSILRSEWEKKTDGTTDNDCASGDTDGGKPADAALPCARTKRKRPPGLASWPPTNPATVEEGEAQAKGPERRGGVGSGAKRAKAAGLR